LDADPSVSTKQKALELLATAYNRQKDYNRAALALLGKWNEAGVSNAKTLHDDVIRMEQQPSQVQ
jgi:hypothetical protein